MIGPGSDKKSERFDNSWLFGPFAKIHLSNSENLNNILARCNKMKFYWLFICTWCRHILLPDRQLFRWLSQDAAWQPNDYLHKVELQVEETHSGEGLLLGGQDHHQQTWQCWRNSQTDQNYRQNYVSHLVNGPSGQRGSTSRGKDIVSRRAENINLKLKEKKSCSRRKPHLRTSIHISLKKTLTPAHTV